MDAPKNVSKVPELTPELLAANEELQTQWRKMYAAPALPTADGYAAVVIQDNLQLLDRMHAQIRGLPLSQVREHVAKMRSIREDTAVWAESIGRVDLAAELTKSSEMRSHCRSIQEAFDRPDDDWCEHPLFRRDENGVVHQVAYREREVFSPVTGLRVSIIRCSECGCRNARDLDRELRKLSDYRAEAMRTGKDPKVSLADVIK